MTHIDCCGGFLFSPGAGRLTRQMVLAAALELVDGRGLASTPEGWRGKP